MEVRRGGTIQTVVQSIVEDSFHRANIFPTYDTACFYMAPLTRTQPTFMTSLLEWGKMHNITFHIGGWTDQCGEDTLNRAASLIPAHTYSRLLTTNVTTFSDIRQWLLDTRSWRWPDNHPIVGHHVASGTRGVLGLCASGPSLYTPRTGLDIIYPWKWCMGGTRGGGRYGSSTITLSIHSN